MCVGELIGYVLFEFVLYVVGLLVEVIEVVDGGGYVGVCVCVGGDDVVLFFVDGGVEDGFCECLIFDVECVGYCIVGVMCGFECCCLVVGVVEGDDVFVCGGFGDLLVEGLMGVFECGGFMVVEFGEFGVVFWFVLV